MMMWPIPEGNPFNRFYGAAQHTDADVRIGREVAGLLRANKSTCRGNIMVEVQNRVVMLSGTVDSRRAHRAAISNTLAVRGVRDICDALREPDPDVPLDGFPGLMSRYDLCTFEHIMASLGAASPPGSAGNSIRRRTRARCFIAMALVWALVSMAIVSLRRIDVIIAWATGTAVTALVLRWGVSVWRAKRREPDHKP
jgi:BON domain